MFNNGHDRIKQKEVFLCSQLQRLVKQSNHSKINGRIIPQQLPYSQVISMQELCQFSAH